MPTVRVNDQVELAYDSFGEGEPLLLIMGLSAQRVLWSDAFCEQLAARGFRVVRFDNRDVGQSTRLDHLPRPNVREVLGRRLVGAKIAAPYTLDDMAEDTVGLMDALGMERAHVVGLSLGGMVAQCMAIRQPARVRSLALLMTAPGELWASLPRWAALRALITRPPTTREAAIEHTLANWRAIGGGGPHCTPREQLLEMCTLQYERGVSPGGFLRQLAAILAAPPRTGALRRLRVPTVVIHGAGDPLLPSLGGRLMAASIPGARLCVVEGLGHDLGPSAWPFTIDAIVQNGGRTLSQEAKPLGTLNALLQPSIRL